MKTKNIFLFLGILLFASLFSLSFLSAGSLNVTEEHPFLVDGEWITASQLQVGDELTTIDGEKVKITEIEDIEVPENESFLVYNLEAGKYSDFVVDGDGYEGLEGVVVHNSNIVSQNLPAVTGIKNFPTKTSLEDQVKYLSENLGIMKGFEEQVSKILLEEFYKIKPDGYIVFGGSRVSGRFHDLSDIDIGFIGLEPRDITKYRNKINGKLNNLFGTSGKMYMSHTYIYPGSKPKSIESIVNPEEFFMRIGIRADGPKMGTFFVPSGWIKISKNGIMHQTSSFFWDNTLVNR